MIQPQFLKKGDEVGIVIPAGKIDMKYIQNAENILANWGLKTLFLQKSITSKNSFSGTDSQRTFAFQQMLDDKQIRAIFCARGGYGSIRIIDQLKFDKFLQSPKWIIGFSDITVFHSLLNNKLDCQSIHATMPINYPESITLNKSLKSLKDALFGKNVSYSFASDMSNKQGIAEGKLIGGNLSILYSLRGTDIDFNSENIILFIEDVGEYVYHIDRMLMNFDRSRVFHNIKGLIVGGMSEVKDQRFIMNKSVNELILEKTLNDKYPIIFNFKAGHIPNNLALIMGRNIQMEVSGNKSCISFL